MITLVLLNDADKSININAKVVQSSFKERITFAAKSFSIYFLIAIAAIFIPVFHFILVPTFLFIAVTIFIKTFRIKSRIEVIDKYLCILCNKELVFPHEINVDQRIQCSHCFHQYKFYNNEVI